MPARTVRILVLGSSPASLKTVTLGNWSGMALFGPRAELAEALRSRKELTQPSIYFLLAPDPENPAITQAYIGEAEEFASRVRDHERRKEWWETFVVFVANNSSLTKAHVRYLEHWFYGRAKAASHRVRVMNENTPPGANLPEPDVADVEEFGKNALFVLGVLGYTLFDPHGSSETQGESLRPGREGEFEMTISRSYQWPDGSPAIARLKVEDGAYILLKGSAVRLDSTDAFHKHAYWKLWKKATEDPALIERVKDNLGRLKADVTVTAPSAAGAIVRARATDGRTEWKQTGSGKTLDEWEVGQ